MSRSMHKGLQAAMAVAMVLGMAAVPTAAFAKDHGHDHGASAHGRDKGHDNQGGDQDNQDDNGGPGALSTTALLQLMSKAKDYYDPMVQAKEHTVQLELTAAAAAQSSTTTTTAVNTQESTLIGQIQSILTQLQAATTVDQEVQLTDQLQKLVGQLNDMVDAPQNPAADGPSLTRDQNDYTQWTNRYQALLTKINDDLALNPQNLTIGDAMQLRGTLVQYVRTSGQTLRVLNKIDEDLSAYANAGSTSGSGGTTPPPTTQTGTASADRSTVVIPTVTVVAGQAFSVSGTVEDANGNPLANTSVVVTFDGKSQTVTTASNGTYGATVTPTTAISDTPVTVVAGGVTISKSTNAASVVAGDLASIGSTVTQKTSVNANSSNTITYTLTDQYGNPIVGKTVDFSLQQAVGATPESTNEATEVPGSLSKVTAVSDANGQVAVTYTSSTTADADADLQDTVYATIPGTSLFNNQAVFTY